MKPAALILGILAAFISLPAALCSGFCAGVAASAQGGNLAPTDANTAADLFLYMGLASGFVAFVSSILVMVRTRIGVIGLAVAFVITVVTCFTLNPLAFGEALFLLVAALLAFFAMRDESRNSMAAPAPVGLPYGAQPPYGAPQQPYGAPQSPYGAPQAQQWGGPPQQPQQPSYGAPQQPQQPQPQYWGGPPQQGGGGQGGGGWGGPPQGQG